MHNLATQLKRLLSEVNLKPTQLAKETGIAQPIIHRLITGKTHNPQLATLLSLAEYFKVDLDELIGRKATSRPAQHNNGPELQLPNCPLISYNWLCEDKSRSTNAFDTSIPGGTFAMRIEDERFMPLANTGYFIIFEPNASAKNLDYILVQLANQNTLSLRQLMIEAETHYLRPIHPQLPSRLQTSGDKVYAVITHIIHCSRQQSSQGLGINRQPAFETAH